MVNLLNFIIIVCRTTKLALLPGSEDFIPVKQGRIANAGDGGEFVGQTLVPYAVATETIIIYCLSSSTLLRSLAESTYIVSLKPYHAGPQGFLVTLVNGCYQHSSVYVPSQQIARPRDLRNSAKKSDAGSYALVKMSLVQCTAVLVEMVRGICEYCMKSLM